MHGEEEIIYMDLSMSKTSELIDHENLFALEIISKPLLKKVVLLAESGHDMKEWVYALRNLVNKVCQGSLRLDSLVQTAYRQVQNGVVLTLESFYVQGVAVYTCL